MDDAYAKRLLDRYREGIATEEEKAVVEDWVSYGRFHEYEISEQDLAEELSSIGAALPLYIRRKNIWPKIAAAAAILMVISAGLYFYTFRTASTVVKDQQYVEDITPGSNKAFLTLGNGKRIDLADTKVGKMTEQAGVKVTKASDGQLLFETAVLSKNASLSEKNDQNKENYNIIETPSGGQYKITLPDGTKVWLNAATSLKFPSTFTRLVSRRVELLRGEAYFEVAKDQAHPFIVKTDQQEVQVLGTHFNINSYKDEPELKTTLLAGSVRVVASNGKETLLKPAQQSSLMNGTFKVNTVDTELAVAWKNNRIMFEDERIEGIMRIISRWYNVEVVYVGDRPTDKFGGAVSRFDNVSKVLQILESTERVHFKISGRKIFVTK